MRPTLLHGGQQRQPDTDRGRSSLGMTTRRRSYSSDGANRKSSSVRDINRRHTASDFRQSQLAMTVTLPRISEDSDTAHSAGELRQLVPGEPPAKGGHVCSLTHDVEDGTDRTGSEVVGLHQTGELCLSGPHSNNVAALEQKMRSSNSPTWHRNILQSFSSSAVPLETPPGRTVAQHEHYIASRTDIAFEDAEVSREHGFQGCPPLRPLDITYRQSFSTTDHHKATVISSIATVPSSELETGAIVGTGSPKFYKPRELRFESPDPICLASHECVSVRSGSSSCSDSQGDLSSSAHPGTGQVLPAGKEAESREPWAYSGLADREGNMSSIPHEVIVQIERAAVSFATPTRTDPPTSVGQLDPPVSISQQTAQERSLMGVDTPRSHVEHQSDLRPQHGSSDITKNLKKNNRVHPL